MNDLAGTVILLFFVRLQLAIPILVLIGLVLGCMWLWRNL